MALERHVGDGVCLFEGLCYFHQRMRCSCAALSSYISQLTTVWEVIRSRGYLCVVLLGPAVHLVGMTLKRCAFE